MVVLEAYRPSPRLSPARSPLHHPHHREHSAAGSLHPPHPLSQQHSPETAYFPFPPHPNGPTPGHDQGPLPQHTMADPGLLSMGHMEHMDLSDGLGWSLEEASYPAYPHSLEHAQSTAWEQAPYRVSSADSAGSRLSGAAAAMAENAQGISTMTRFPSSLRPSPPSSHRTHGSELTREAMAMTGGHPGPRRAASAAPPSTIMGRTPDLSLDGSQSWSSATSQMHHPSLEDFEHYYPAYSDLDPHMAHPPHPAHSRAPSYGEEEERLAEEDRPVLLHHPGSSLAHPHSPSGTTDSGPAASYSAQLAVQQAQQMRAAQEHAQAALAMEMDLDRAREAREQRADMDLLRLHGLGATYPPPYAFQLQPPPGAAEASQSGPPRPSLTPGRLPPPVPPLSLAGRGPPPPRFPLRAQAGATAGGLTPPPAQAYAALPRAATAGGYAGMPSYFDAAPPPSPPGTLAMFAGPYTHSPPSATMRTHTLGHSPAPLLSLE